MILPAVARTGSNQKSLQTVTITAPGIKRKAADNLDSQRYQPLGADGLCYEEVSE